MILQNVDDLLYVLKLFYPQDNYRDKQKQVNVLVALHPRYYKANTGQQIKVYLRFQVIHNDLSAVIADLALAVIVVTFVHVDCYIQNEKSNDEPVKN